MNLRQHNTARSLVSFLLRRVLCLCLIKLSFLSPQALNASDRITSLNDLEKPLLRAKSLGEFLQSETLLSEYYKSLKDYYGFDDKQFPRSSYDIFINQIKELASGSEEFEMALWNPSRDFGSEHSFAIDKVPPGLSLERNTFKLFWVDYYEKAITLIRRSFKDFKPEKLPANVIGLLKKTSDQMREFELSINILGKKAQRLKRAEYYNSLVRNKTLRIAVLAYYFHILDKESVVSNWDEKSDLEIQQWLTDPRKFLNKEDHPKAFFQLISYHLFQKKDLVEKEVLIGIPNLMEKEVLQQGEYRFIPSPRGIHSVFKGVCHKECIGGNEDSITS